jgi:hypothetical protein
MAKKEHTRNVYRICGTPAQLIGRVEAPDEKAPIKKAIEEFKITDAAAQKRRP